MHLTDKIAVNITGIQRALRQQKDLTPTNILEISVSR